MISGENNGLFDLPSLDELGDKYGETNERDFWPVVRCRYRRNNDKIQHYGLNAGDDEAEIDALCQGL